MFASRDRNITNQISLALLPGTRLDTVLAFCGRPQAETVMMFSDEHNVLSSGGFCSLHPLLGVDIGGIENPPFRPRVSPLPIHQPVRAEMNASADLSILPHHLL